MIDPIETVDNLLQDGIDAMLAALSLPAQMVVVAIITIGTALATIHLVLMAVWWIKEVVADRSEARAADEEAQWKQWQNDQADYDRWYEKEGYKHSDRGY